eukprot:TRINITY_DN17271_c0_g1_i3.p1 TRINITY_DN17271_c0_g1~~TRINITY_DN17271_c0_g1_i3.p1  ORF type:complete len:319 (-),score=91.61 TRINITY_DN17271_c0_g1_i3:339-1295(-)
MEEKACEIDLVERRQEPDDLNDLVSSAIKAMQQAGDFEEAEDIQRLANFCSLEAELIEEMRPMRPKKRPRQSLEEDGSAAMAEAGAEAMKCLLRGFSDEEFPVELDDQASTLRWNKRWRRELGSFKEFVESHDDALQMINCPGGFCLVLPRRRSEDYPEGVIGNGTGSSCCTGKYLDWCRQQRVSAKGKFKQKWRHVETTIGRLCRILDRAQSNVDRSESSEKLEDKGEDKSRKVLKKADGKMQKDSEPDDSKVAESRSSVRVAAAESSSSAGVVVAAASCSSTAGVESAVGEEEASSDDEAETLGWVLDAERHDDSS